MNTSNLLVIGGAVALVGVYLLDKQKKEKDALVSQMQIQPEPQNNTPPIVESNFYTPVEANKKALEVVTKLSSLLDAIPKEALAQESISTINFKLENEKREKLIANYKKALEDARKAKKLTFTFENITFYTENEEDVRNGRFSKVLGKDKWIPSNTNYYVNNFKGVQSYIADSLILGAVPIMKFKKIQTLGDLVKQFKTVDYAKAYDDFKVAFTLIPKADVNRLVILLPKLYIAETDFQYLRTQYEKNPLTLEEQLFVRDIDLENLLSRKRYGTREDELALIRTREELMVKAIEELRKQEEYNTSRITRV